MRRCSNRSEFFSSPKCKIANQVVQKFLKEYKALTQSKRSLLSKARKLRKSIHTFEGISSALRQQVQYVDFALSVTATVPGIDDLEDDQLRQIFTEVLRLSDNCPTSMMSLSTVCKRWGKLVRSADVWKALHLNKLANSVADHELLVLLGNDKAFSKSPKHICPCWSDKAGGSKQEAPGFRLPRAAAFNVPKDIRNN